MAVNKATLGNRVLIDLTSDTVTPATLLRGSTAHDKSGEIITGAFLSGYPNNFELDEYLEDSSGNVIADSGNAAVVSAIAYTRT